MRPGRMSAGSSAWGGGRVDGVGADEVGEGGLGEEGAGASREVRSGAARAHGREGWSPRSVRHDSWEAPHREAL